MKKLFDSTPSQVVSGNSEDDQSMDIAIIGMAGRIGEADNLDSFWNKIIKGHSFLTNLSDKRAEDISKYLDFSGIKRDSVYFKPASFMEDISSFDHGFFNISHAEAITMYPDQRLFLENVWHALEDAGYAGSRVKGTRTGVYVGYAREENRYIDIIKAAEPELAGLALTGNVASIMAGRVAHFLDTKGPTMLVNTACSSSMAALHQACQAIKNKDCEMAIVGSVQIALLPVQSTNVEIGALGVESSNGLTRTFDDTSDGTGGGEGSITFIIKPLDKAVQDHDRIHAVIKGSAINHDGSSLNIAAPNVAAQEEVIVAAWKNAGIDPMTISYIEAHGTGTPIGDPIEIAGLTAAFRRYTDKSQFCAISAVKSNIGHLDAAAGVAGVAKAVLSLKNRTIAPSLHFNKPNKHINFEESPVFVNTRPMPWKNGKHPLRCGVSSFGVSGTNVHVVLEEAPHIKERSGEEEKSRLFIISATNDASLRELVARYVHTLNEQVVNFGDLCYTVSIGRGHFSSRLGVIAENTPDLLDKLQVWLADTHVGQDSCIFEGNVPALKNDVTAAQRIRKLSEEAELWVDNHVNKTLDREALEKLAVWYVKGADISWQTLFVREKRNIISLPFYSFQEKKCWFEIPESYQSNQEEASSQALAPMTNAGKTPPIEGVAISPVDEVSETIGEDTTFEERREDIFNQFKSYFSKSFEIPEDTITPETNIYEIGLDSLSIVQVRQLIKKQYKVDVPVIDLFKKYVKIGDLSDFIADQVKGKTSAKKTATAKQGRKPVITHDGSTSGLAEELLSIQGQLGHLIDRIPELSTEVPKKKLEYKPDQSKVAKPVHAVQAPKTDKELLGPEQLAYIESFATKYQKRTAKSLAYTLEHMSHFANNRNVSAFKKEFKKLQYTIIADSAEGFRLWDIDGNEYIDFAMGFGVFFMGHSHPVIRKSIEQQVAKGTFLGPLSKLPGEVAELISELAGVERVAFYNSGTEAVMVSIRLARAATGRNKIVFFSGSYHGMFDGVLAQRNPYEEHYETIPLANGIPKAMVDDVYVLEYDDPNALQFIEEHAEEIAAVIVEPVQSRRPELQPFEFLAGLRKVSSDRGICLVFDEIINGFRISAGGAQEFFNVEADLVTYGKVAGGGLPLGIVAGKAAYLDGIDGGVWDPMGDSLPKFDHRRTIVAGTFCHHPLAMASAKAMLEYIKSEGQALYDRINDLTSAFVGRMNQYFEADNVPIRLYNFGSMFHFRSDVDLKFFFYHLVDKGIYVWEGATFFISTVHTVEEVNRFEQAIKESIAELREAGMMESGEMVSSLSGNEKMLPITDEQLRIWLKSQESPQASASLNEVIHLTFDGKPDEEAITQAFAELLQRHESLRVKRVTSEGQYVQLGNTTPPALIKIQPEGETLETRRKNAEKWMREEAQKPFSLQNGMVKICLISDEGEGFMVILIIHQIIADGYSLSLIQSEFQQLYFAYKDKQAAVLPEASDFSEYIEAVGQRTKAEYEKLLSFWLEDWQKPFGEAFSPDPFHEEGIPKQKWINIILPDSLFEKVKEFSKGQRTTPFTVLLTAYSVLLGKLTDRKDVLIGVPSVGQLLLDNPLLVGQCMQMLPLRFQLNEGPFQETLEQIGNKFALLQEYRNFSVTDIIAHASEQDKICHVPDVHMVFNMDPAINTGGPAPRVEEVTFSKGEGRLAKYDLFVNLVEVNKQLHLSFQYNNTVFQEEDIQYWINVYVDILQNMVVDPSTTVPAYKVPGVQLPGSLIDKKAGFSSWTDLLCGEKKIATEIFMNGVSLDVNTIVDNANQIASHPSWQDQSIKCILLYSDNIAETLSFMLACELIGKTYGLASPELNGGLDILDEKFDLVIVGENLQLNGKFPKMDYAEVSKVSQVLTHSPTYDFDKLSLVLSKGGYEIIPHKITDHYLGLKDLSSRLDFPDRANIWLIPEGISPEELLNWWWLSVQEEWNLCISSDTPDTGDIDEPWIICGERSSLESLAGNKDCYGLFAHTWVVITDEAINSLFIQQLATTRHEIYLHVITRVCASSAYGFHYHMSYQIRNALQWIPSGKPLHPFSFNVHDKSGTAVPPQVPGTLVIAGHNDQWIETNYSSSYDVTGDFKLWSSQKDTFTFGGFTLDASLILETIHKHPQVASAHLLQKGNDTNIESFDLELTPHQGEDVKLNPSNFLKSFLNKGLLPTKIDWPGKQEQQKGIGSNYDKDKAEILLNCLSEVLGISQITLEDNYLSLGGSSIKAIHLVAVIKKKLGISISPARLFQMDKLEEILSPVNSAGEAIEVAGPEASEKPYYPLSYAQKRFWVVEQLEDGIHTSNLVEARNIYGKVDEAVYFKACAEVVNRHESLRTIFTLEGDEAVQKILEGNHFDYMYETWEEEGYLEKVNELVNNEILSPFDLQNGPLLRIRLLQISETHYVTILVTHHIIFDGWSFDVLMRDIIGAYINLLNGKPAFSTPLPIQFKDYCVWQNQLISDQLEELRGYWKNKHQPLAPPLNILQGATRPSLKNQQGGMVPLIVDTEVTASLVKVARANGASMFMMVHTTLLALLHCYTKQTDICMGTPVADRENEKLQNQVGCLINTLAIRSTFEKESSFLELLDDVKQNTLEAFEHKLYPFDLILNDIQYQRDPARNPLFDVGFTFHENQYIEQMPEVGNLGIRSETIAPELYSVKTDLWFHSSLNAQNLGFTILYDNAIYQEGFISDLIEDYKFVLHTLSTRPGIKLNELLMRFLAITGSRTSKRQLERSQKQRKKLQKIKKARPAVKG